MSAIKGNTTKVLSSTQIDPGKSKVEQKPKKAAALRQVIEDAAKYNQNDSTSGCNQSNAADDYESGKVTKGKCKKYDDEVKMVQDLDRWG